MSTVVFDVSDSPLLSFSGPDRAKSLHNLTTQEIKKLQPGDSSEGFVTSPQGKTIGFFTIHVLDDSILIRTDPGATALALPHFEKYTMFDDVHFEDVTDKFEQRLLIGGAIAEAADAALFGSSPLGIRKVAESQNAEFGQLIGVIQQTYGTNCLLLITEKGKMAKALDALRSVGLELSPGDPQLLERLRVLSAWPRFDQEIKADNLPQEIDRDASAINFHKGCYLGQETVARLDALGHVNRILMGFTLESDHVPIDPETLVQRSLVNEAGQVVGEIRSAVAGEHGLQVAGFALVRVKALEGVVKVANAADATLTLLKPAEFRVKFRPLVDSLVG